MLRFRLILIAIGAIFLGACTSTGIRTGSALDRTGERWQLSGKIGLRAPQLAESAYVNWRQCGAQFNIRISGPLGQTVARIEGRDEQLILQFEGREAMATREPEALMQQQLGWSLPIRALRYWVRAEAAPGSAAEFSGPSQQPNTLQQDQWRVDYLAYHQSNTATLPAKLRLSGDQNLQATLLINEWSLGDAVDCPH
ncbi:MAG: lipoprotein insertase outer membrane protein LolB [Spongiibacteraceae bacterium]